ncbi:MAG: homoserine kinase [Cytophagales bacterium]|nr:homoserine kinase [Cytophagales bacterium]MDW8383826.1 homoserine kinase [Flammeovirgaceae bacterium]
MNTSPIRIFSPATVANVACGFDVLGFCLNHPGDEISMRLIPETVIRIINKTHFLIPTEPHKNTLGVSLQAFLNALNYRESGFEIIIEKKIMPGSGVGSSSASAAASVVGANYLLGNKYSKADLVQYAMQGELAASGAAHADNVAPALLGGFVLIRSYKPLDIVQIPYPADLYAAVVHPQIEVRTEDARRVLKKYVPLKDAITQWGNVGGLIAGLYRGDYELIGRSLEDVIVEPVRSLLIPSYKEVKKTALENGALGCSISGSGPSIFALCRGKEVAEKVAHAMSQKFQESEIENCIYVSAINPKGTIVLN